MPRRTRRGSLTFEGVSGRFERKHEPLLPRREFVVRVLRSVITALILIALSLALGAVGYHSLAHLGWLDAIHAAAMILTGMGTAGELEGDAAKVFETCYALFSSLVFLTVAALILGPLAHRLIHRFHLAEDDGEDGGS
jgi:hypothetical protein